MRCAALLISTLLLCPQLLSLSGCAKTAAAVDERAAFPVNELGVRPPVLEGVRRLSPEELAAGKVLLFDGVSLYGWTVENGSVKIEGDRVVGDVGVKLTRYLPHRFKLAHSGVNEAALHEWGNEKLIVTLNSKSVGVDFLSMTIEPLATELLLADDLAGWERRGKVEAICKDGVLRLVGGSGSLEYTRAVADFLLQLEFKTERSLNSGVFFRCVPGSTMDGYECQLFNNPPEGDFAKFLGTQTGGLFRRQVGRDVAPRDGEWVAVTILASGNKFATWVNGVQVTSWEDFRHADANPRRGCRTEAGTIQLQGHDPTTDIIFRNIRIVKFE